MRKTALITGTSSGIGLATALLFAERGMAVSLIDCSPTGSTAAVEKIVATGGAAAFFETDISNAEQVESAVGHTAARFGRVDVIVNCAAVQVLGSLEKTSDQAWDRQQEVNLKGAFLVCRAAMPHLRKAGAGSIVNISSVLAFVGDPDLVAYSSMKGGLLALTKSLAIAYGPEGVRVNAVCPGDVNTPMVQDYFQKAPNPDALHAEVFSKYALRRIAEPREIAEVAWFLASDASSFITGATIVADGGLTSKCY